MSQWLPSFLILSQRSTRVVEPQPQLISYFGGSGSKFWALCGGEPVKSLWISGVISLLRCLWSSDCRLFVSLRPWMDSALAAPSYTSEMPENLPATSRLCEGPGILEASSLFPSPLGFAPPQNSVGEEDTEHPALISSPSLRDSPSSPGKSFPFLGGGLGVVSFLIMLRIILSKYWLF